LEAFQLNRPNERIRDTPHEIASVGFFYLDRVKCWYCNGGLRNWKREDMRSTMRRICEIVSPVRVCFENQGVEFVENVVQRYPKLKRPKLINASMEVEILALKDYVSLLAGCFVKLQNSAHFEDPRKQENICEQKVRDALENNKEVEYARACGFDDEKLEECYFGWLY